MTLLMRSLGKPEFEPRRGPGTYYMLHARSRTDSDGFVDPCRRRSDIRCRLSLQTLPVAAFFSGFGVVAPEQYDHRRGANSPISTLIRIAWRIILLHCSFA
jgi:hypothetical protein